MLRRSPEELVQVETALDAEASVNLRLAALLRAVNDAKELAS